MNGNNSKIRLIMGGKPIANNLQFKDNGLIPAIIQDANSSEVLMLGYMNQEAVERTLNSGEVWFYSRSRKEMWHKGATSGNRFIVQELWQDCDSDTILVKVRPLGPACHTGNQTCFFQRLKKDTS